MSHSWPLHTGYVYSGGSTQTLYFSESNVKILHHNERSYSKSITSRMYLKCSNESTLSAVLKQYVTVVVSRGGFGGAVNNSQT